MSDDGGRDEALVGDVRDKARELTRLLDTYSERLRRMRQRNREVEAEIGSFEEELERLRRWLDEHA